MRTQYRLWFGWHGMVWTSGVPAMIVMAPAHLTRHEVCGIMGDEFHCQCSWLKVDYFEGMWAELFDDRLPGFEWDILRVIGDRND